MARRKKKTNEAEYEVVVRDTTPGAKTPEKATKVNAVDPKKAVELATGGKPARDAEEIAVKKKVPGAPKPPGGAPVQGGVNSVESVKPKSMKAITEAVDYPYSISLPQQFQGFLEKLNIPHNQVGHTVMMRFDNKNQLTEALRAFNKSDNPKAEIVLNGINRSLS